MAEGSRWAEWRAALRERGAAGYILAEMDTFVRHGLPVIAVVGKTGFRKGSISM